MFALIPLNVDVPMYRLPWANVVLIAGIFVTSLYALAVGLDAVDPYILNGWEPSGLFGHMALHAGAIHLMGNLIFLFAFGNAVCAKVGNALNVPLFVAFGLAAAAVHNLLDGQRMIGASGAINGIVGMFLVLYPRNDMTCGWWFLIRVGTFSLSSYWMILLWLAFDLWGAAASSGGDGGIAYFAHLGGFACGFATAWLALRQGWIEMEDDEQSLPDLIAGGR